MTETPPPPTDGPTGSAGATSTAPPPPPPPAAPVPEPLHRPREGRVFRGVCAAVGRATGTDPVLWRVLVVVFLFFGGAGLVLYIAGWLFLPDEGEPATELQRLFRGQGASTSGAIGLAVLVVIATLVVFDDGRGLLPLIVIAGLAYLVVRDRQSTTVRPAGAPGTGTVPPPAGWAPPPAWTAPAGTPPGGWGPAGGFGPLPPPPPPIPPRPRSPLGLLTVSAAVLVVGGMLLAGSLGVEGITATRVLAAALLVTGVGLLVGTVWGRARGLIALALVLALALGATSSFVGRFGTSTGEQDWVVSGSAEHELGAGTATLDLRPLAGGRTAGVTVEASVGAGELIVLVPEDLRVAIDSNVGFGEYTLTDLGVTEVAGGGADLERAVLLGPPGTAAVRVEAAVGVGSLEVRRVPAR